MTAGRASHYIKYYDRNDNLLLTGSNRANSSIDAFIGVDAWKKNGEAMDYTEPCPPGTDYVVAYLVLNASFAGSIYLDNVVLFN
jgi:hypothetical protein